MDSKLLEKAKIIASNSYTVEVNKEITSDGKSLYLAKNPELYGCMAQGASSNEAIENLFDARVDYIYSLLVDNIEVPLPENQRKINDIYKTITTESGDFKVIFLEHNLGENTKPDHKLEKEIQFSYVVKSSSI